jgi:hypothetical protein
MLTIENYDGISPLVSSESATGMEREETSAKDRDGNGKGTDGMLMEWSRPDASYTLRFRKAAGLRLSDYGDGSLLFSMANSEWQIESGGLLPPLPDAELTVADDSGKSWSVQLADIIPFQPPSYTAFMKFGWLERTVKDNKYKAPAEAVFQSFVVPLKEFRSDQDEEDGIKPEEIASLTFTFRSATGKVMIDDIGFMKQGGTYVEYESTS